MKHDSASVLTSDHNQTLNRVGECLYRSENSGVYYAIFKRAGKQIKRSLKTTDKQLARRRLDDLSQKVARLNTKGGGNILFSELAQRWLTASTSTVKVSTQVRRGSAIGSLSPFYKTHSVRSLAKSHVEQWAAQRAHQVAARTFNLELETLVLIFDYAVREGLILENPAKCIPRKKLPKPQIIIPTKSQFKTMVEQILQLDSRAAQAATLCEFLAYSGCRLGEATGMQWGDVNFEMQSFTVTGGEDGTKNHEARTVPLFPPLERLLLAFRDSLPQLPQPTDKIFSIGSAKKAITSACRNANFPHYTHHTMRHFFCSNAIEAGIDFKVIASWLGHKDGGVLVARTYGHLRDEHSTLMAKRMTFDISAESVVPSNVVTMAMQ